MKKIIYVLGTAALVVLVTVAVGFAILATKGSALDAESKSYIDGAVSAIAKHWSKNDLIERASPELLASLKPDQVAALFGSLSRLGTMTKYEGATGEATMSYIGSTGALVSARYGARAQFENRSAIFRIALMRRDGRWVINSFYVDTVPSNQSGQGA